MEIMEIFADSRDVHQHKENPAKGERERFNSTEQLADCRLTHIPVLFSSHMGRGQTPVKCSIYGDYEKTFICRPKIRL
jgi:hypothetical protein